MNNEVIAQTLDFEPGTEQGSGFKIKLTNLRKVYPTNTPDVSDINKFKLGDYIVRHRAENVIYQVISIVREPIPPTTLDSLLKKITSSNGSVINHLQRFHEPLLEYKKNGNFGACRIYYRTVMRGGKRMTNGRLMNFLEIHQIDNTNYGKVDIQEAIKLQEINIKNAEYKMMRYDAIKRQHETRRDNARRMRAELATLLPQPVQSPIVQMDVENQATLTVIDELIAA